MYIIRCLVCCRCKIQSHEGTNSLYAKTSCFDSHLKVMYDHLCLLYDVICTYLIHNLFSRPSIPTDTIRDRGPFAQCHALGIAWFPFWKLDLGRTCPGLLGAMMGQGVWHFGLVCVFSSYWMLREDMIRLCHVSFTHSQQYIGPRWLRYQVCLEWEKIQLKELGWMK